MAVANGGVAYMPNKKIQAFEEAIESVMMVFATPDDYVLMRRLPSSDFLVYFTDKGLPIPNFMLVTEALTKRAFLELPKGEIKPWGWSASMHRWLKPLNNMFSTSSNIRFADFWKDDYKNLFSRELARDVLASILQTNIELPFISSEALPVVCRSADEIEVLLTKYRKGVIKAPWSSSGRGIQMLTRSEMTTPLRSWIEGMLQQQSLLLFEQLQSKVQDLSFQFSVKDGRATFLGYSFFYASSNGQYEGNYVNLNPKDLPKEVSDLFVNGTISKTVLAVEMALNTSEIAKRYCGNLGVDLLLFRDENGDIIINPCLEINLRYTMGMVALRLTDYLLPTVSGRYEMWFGSNTTFADFVLEQKEQNPLVLEGGKIVRGFLPLSANWESSIGAYLIVGD